MIIAIDFDGTVVKHAYPKIGEDIGAIPVLKEFVKRGHQLILNTMRSGDLLNEAVKWFSDNGIELTGVNQCPGQITWTTSPKVYAQVYIDDAALGAPTSMDEKGNIFIDWRIVARAFGYKYDELLKNE